MKRHSTLIVVLAALLAVPMAAAQNTPAPSSPANTVHSEFISLDALLAEMLARNPELRAARKRWEAMQKRPGQEGALPDPTVRLGWASAGTPLPGGGIGTEPIANIGIEIAQIFPFPGKRSLKAGMAWREAEAESFMFDNTELTLVSRLKAAYHDLQFVYDATEVLARNRSLLEQLAQVAQSRYSVGQGNQQDLIKSQVEISVLQTRQVELDRRRQSLESEINALLSREPGAELARPEPVGQVPVLLPVEKLQSIAMQNAPTLRAQRSTIDSRQLGLEVARRDYYPDLEVMGGYFNQGSMKDMWEFRFELNIPIYFARKQRLGVEEAGARLAEAQSAFRSQEQMLTFRIKDQYLAAETSRRLMDLYSKLIAPQARLALESSLSSYETGSVDFLSVLSNLTTILENEMNYYESRTQFLRAVVGLEELVGEPVSG